MNVVRWWPSAVGVVLGCLAGVTLLLLSPKAYTATTTLFIGSPVSADSAGAYAGDLFGQQRAVSYSQLFTSDDLAAKVIDDLSLKLNPAELIAQVSAKQLPKTVLLEVSVTDASPQRAADIANAYASNFAAYVSRLETPATSSQSVAKINVVRKATAPAKPSSPNALIDLGGGLAGGAALGGLAQWRMGRTTRPGAAAPTAAARSRRRVGAVRREVTGNEDTGNMDFATQVLPRAEVRTRD
ncbi:MAG: capsular polysaccharide biosynthesis protein [Nocardia sp.]|uniref:YveK family protein n=1 Tax=Nocardia sp. TaxID=1821 RepID=UPI0026280CD2|nr:Wzz/FepE/Etk N-terminal domain-containing protein [Nocardia sp.]MCU1648144.1 capsular polysaccharide biosynthesis protein [Nocardia sp.]